MLADAAAELHYWVTLHGWEGSNLTIGDLYTIGCHQELGTVGGYTQGGQPVTYNHFANNGLLTAVSTAWTATSGGIGLVFYGACWVSKTDDISTAKLLWVNDMSATPQQASIGNQMTVAIGQNITVPVPY
jgi:hypothetical protein